MKTINADIENLLVIKNSKFITYLYYVDNIDYINKLLLEIKNKHDDANHVCYAYRLENTVKFSDDGEPKGTAGMPMLSILEKNDLVNTLVVVVRYFGGIKLGAGGLIRAYGNSCKEALSLVNKSELKEMLEITFSFSYEIQSNIDYFLRDEVVLKREFTDKVIYSTVLNDELYKNLLNYNVTIIDEKLIKKRV